MSIYKKAVFLGSLALSIYLFSSTHKTTSNLMAFGELEHKIYSNAKAIASPLFCGNGRDK